MRTLFQDIRFGIRMLKRNPGFAVTAIVCLGLGIGACSAIVSVVDTALFRPLPFPDPERLVHIRQQNPEKIHDDRVSASLVGDVREQVESFEAIATWGFGDFHLTGGEFSEILGGAQVSADFFQTVGIEPALGRTFLPGEDQRGKDNVLVISHGLWRRRFGGDPNVVGKSISANGRSHTIVGVMPPRFQFYLSAEYCEIWQPYVTPRYAVDGMPGYPYTIRRLTAVGRLKLGVSRKQAQAEADLLALRLAEQYPKTNKGWTIRVDPARTLFVDKEIRQSLWLLVGAVVFVLLIGCANVANLLLGRAASRQKEMAIRATLGAGWWRVMRLVLTESLLLALLGTGVGILVAHWGIGLLKPLIPGGLPVSKEVVVDGRMLTCALFILFVTGVGLGLAPAWQACRANLTVALKEGGTRSVGGPGRKPLRKSLVVCEVALALMLFMGAGLMIQSVVRLLRVDPGFNPENLLQFDVGLPRQVYAGGMYDLLPRYEHAGDSDALYDCILEYLESLPGVRSVGARSGGWGADYIAEGQTIPVELSVRPCSVGTHDYLRTMGIPLLQGRHLTNEDVRSGDNNIIINEAAANQIFPGENPIGKQIRMRTHEEPPPWLTVVGVARNIRSWSYDQQEGAKLYIPYKYKDPNERSSSATFVVCTAGDPFGLVKPIRCELQTIDKDLRVSGFEKPEDQLYRSTARQRLYMKLLTIFAVLGLVIAAVGIYGVISYSVVQRTHEMGIRMALGAERSDVFKLVIKKGLILIAVGLVIGVAGALALTRVLASLLYGVTPTDPMTFVAVSMLLMVVGLMACYIPARRATRIDPMSALRYE